MAGEHDLRYKMLFSNPLIVEELLKYFVKEEFVKDLDFTTLERQDKSFVGKNFKEKESDLIWKISFKGQEVYIYLLIEFQSSVDKYMALRFGRYLFEFYSILSQRKDIDLLPAVFPILIYNGDSRWTACDNIKDLIIPSIHKQYIPSFRYYKIIENEFSKKSLLKIGNALSAIFYVENCSTEEVKSSINELTAILEREQPALISLFKEWFNNMLESTGVSSKEAGITVGKLNKLLEVDSMFTTAIKEHEKKYEKIGMEKGIQKGIAEGLEKGRKEIAREMLEMGMSTDVIARATKLSSEAIEKLRAQL